MTGPSPADPTEERAAAALPVRPSYRPWASAVTANVVVHACGLLAGIIIARLLGPTGRGIVAAAVLWPVALHSGAALINLSTVTYVGARFGERGLRASLWIGAVLGFALVPVSWLVNRLALGQVSPSLVYANWYSLIIPLGMLASVMGGALLVERRLESLWGTRLVAAIVTLGGVAVLAGLGRLSVGSYVAVALVGAAIGTFAAAAIQRSLKNIFSPPGKHVTGEVLRFGHRALLTLIAARLGLWLDQLVISRTLSAATLGHYAVAFSWSSAVLVVGAGFSTVVLSRTAGVDLQDHAAIQVAIARVRRAGLVIMLAAVAASILSPLGVRMLFGPQYTAAVVPAIILSLAAGPLAWSGCLHEFARGIGEPALGRRPELFGLAALAIGLFLLMPPLGATGAALASLVGRVVLTIAFIRRLSDVLSSSPRRSLWPSPSDARHVVSGSARYMRLFLQRTRHT